MKLYYTPGACSLSPHITLCEAQLPYQLVRVDLQTAQTENGRDYREINPHGYVPALELDDGQILLEGPAIVQYIADRVPEKELAPATGTLGRYRLQQWLNFISSELHKGFGAFFNPAFPDDAKALFSGLLKQRLDVIAPTLDASDWLLGDTFTVADAYLFTVLNWSPMIDFDLSPWPSLTRYQQRVAARPAVQTAMQEEGLI